MVRIANRNRLTKVRQGRKTPRGKENTIKNGDGSSVSSGYAGGAKGNKQSRVRSVASVSTRGKVRASIPSLNICKATPKKLQSVFDFDEATSQDTDSTDNPLDGQRVAVSVFTKSTSPSKSGVSTRRKSGPRSVRKSVLELEDLSMSYRSVIESLGGTFHPSVVKTTTHLVFFNGPNSVASKAVKNNVKIVSCAWIHECRKSGKRANEEQFSVDVSDLIEKANDARRRRSSIGTFYCDVDSDEDIPRVKRSRKSKDPTPVTHLPSPSDKRFSSSQMIARDSNSSDEDDEILFPRFETTPVPASPSPITTKRKEQENAVTTPTRAGDEGILTPSISTPKSPKLPSAESGTRPSDSCNRNNKFVVGNKGLNSSAIKHSSTTVLRDQAEEEVQIASISSADDCSKVLLGVCNVSKQFNSLLPSLLERLGKLRPVSLCSVSQSTAPTHIVFGTNEPLRSVQSESQDIDCLLLAARGGVIVSPSWLLDSCDAGQWQSELAHSLARTQDCWFKGAKLVHLFASIDKQPDNLRDKWLKVLHQIADRTCPSEHYHSVVNTMSLVHKMNFFVKPNVKPSVAAISEVVVTLGGSVSRSPSTADFIITEQSESRRTSRRKVHAASAPNVSVETLLNVLRNGSPLVSNDQDISQSSKCGSKSPSGIKPTKVLTPRDAQFLELMFLLSNKIQKDGLNDPAQCLSQVVAEFDETVFENSGLTKTAALKRSDTVSSTTSRKLVLDDPAPTDACTETTESSQSTKTTRGTTQKQHPDPTEEWQSTKTTRGRRFSRKKDKPIAKPVTCAPTRNNSHPTTSNADEANKLVEKLVRDEDSNNCTVQADAIIVQTNTTTVGSATTSSDPAPVSVSKPACGGTPNTNVDSHTNTSSAKSTDSRRRSSRSRRSTATIDQNLDDDIRRAIEESLQVQQSGTVESAGNVVASDTMTNESVDSIAKKLSSRKRKAGSKHVSNTSTNSPNARSKRKRTRRSTAGSEISTEKVPSREKACDGGDSSDINAANKLEGSTAEVDGSTTNESTQSTKKSKLKKSKVAKDVHRQNKYTASSSAKKAARTINEKKSTGTGRDTKESRRKTTGATQKKSSERKQLAQKMVIAYSKCDNFIVDLLESLRVRHCSNGIESVQVIHGSLEEGSCNEAVITHVVVGDETKRTAKVLLGLASGAWILQPSWVLATVEEQEWANEKQHVVDSTLYPSIKYRTQMPKLFAGENIHIRTGTKPSKAILSKILVAAGASISSRLAGASLTVEASDKIRSSGKQLTNVKSDQWVIQAITKGSAELPDPSQV